MSPAHQSVLLMLRQLGRRYAPGPLPEWNTFAASTRLIAVNPRESISAGERDIFILVRGLAKVVNVDPKHSEPYVEEFIEAPGVMAPRLRPAWATTTSPPLAIARRRSGPWSLPPQELVAIERTHMLQVDYRVLEALCARHPQWGQIHAAFLWTAVESVYSVIRSMRTKDAEQRYRGLLANRPSLVGRVSQRDLASYLNITESALSRIVRRVRENDAAAQAASEAAKPESGQGDGGETSEVTDCAEAAKPHATASVDSSPTAHLGHAAQA